MMSSEVIANLIAGGIGAFVSGLITWNLSRSNLSQNNLLMEKNLKDAQHELRKTKSDLYNTQQQANKLSHFERRYQQVRTNLQRSSVVKEYTQPVILIGPRAVGKTSLLSQWHTPWDHSRLSSTQRHSTSTIPIYDFKKNDCEPHFADPDIQTDVNIHLKLKVHDFPGELGSQKNITEQARSETEDLRRKTGKSLGIVLICMFDAGAVNKNLPQSTVDYYNGELFGNLRSLVSYNEINIERLVLVFNKYDVLKGRYPSKDDKTLLNECIDFYKPTISLLRGTCNPERVCEVFTILSREDMISNNRGAPIVLGESSRAFIEAMAGVQAMRDTVKESATTYSAPIFS